jgi:membrane carboxypeptidase/penicillin-binding protein
MNEENVTTVATEENAANEGVKTYTEEEVMALLQREADKRVTEALKKQEKKHQKELSLSKLDDDARANAEKDNKIAELEERLAQYDIERNKSELKSVLASRGLSAEFADIITITDDIETSQANIDKLDKLFKTAVRAEVEKRLAGTAPKGNGNGTPTITKESIAKMSVAELQQLKKTNPVLYNNLYN